MASLEIMFHNTSGIGNVLLSFFLILSRFRITSSRDPCKTKYNNTYPHCRDRLPKMLFSHPQFPKNCAAALTDCITVLDKEVNKGKTITMNNQRLLAFWFCRGFIHICFDLLDVFGMVRSQVFHAFLFPATP